MTLTALLVACSAQAHDTPKIFLDPGHGASGNPGNESALCVSEQDAMLALALKVEERLLERGARVELARREGELVSYDDRLEAAKTWDADVFVSLHSDVRAASPEDEGCASVDDGEGFSILWGEDADDATLPGKRRDLARAIGTQMARSGFVPYRGDSYGTLYIEDEVVPGVFVDRHEPHQRIKMLRRPVMPSVLVETHHAWVADEAELWTHPVVVVAFADALFEAVTQGR